MPKSAEKEKEEKIEVKVNKKKDEKAEEKQGSKKDVKENKNTTKCYFFLHFLMISAIIILGHADVVEW